MDIFGGNMNIKMYNFRYPNSAQKFTISLMNFVSNFAYPIIFCWIVFIIMALCGVLHYLSIELCLVFLGISAVLGLIFALRYTFSYKGVILYDTYMEIITNNIVGHKSKITIQYTEIASVYNSNYNLRYDRKKARRSFLAGDQSYYVELTLKGGKEFCFSTENQQELTEELIFRIDSLKNK